jgi:putative ABC transport system ATP-binding protein
LLLDPKVLLLDEPASALDEESSRIVEETAERLCLESGLTVLMVSHRKFEPKLVKYNVLQIANGRVEELK